MNICMSPKCSNEISSKRKFCSLSCVNVGRSRRSPKKIYTKLCANTDCSIEFTTSIDKTKYCSGSCAAHVNNKIHKKLRQGLPSKICLMPSCNTIIYKGLYCNIKCRQGHEEQQYADGILDGNSKYTITAYARRYITKRAENRCEGFDERIPGRCTETRVIQIDHIDGNWRNSGPDNLRALCPTCHTLTDTYAGRNKGKGRTWKKDYSQYKPKDLTAQSSGASL